MLQSRSPFGRSHKICRTHHRHRPGRDMTARARTCLDAPGPANAFAFIGRPYGFGFIAAAASFWVHRAAMVRSMRGQSGRRGEGKDSKTDKDAFVYGQAPP